VLPGGENSGGGERMDWCCWPIVVIGRRSTPTPGMMGMGMSMVVVVMVGIVVTPGARHIVRR